MKSANPFQGSFPKNIQRHWKAGGLPGASMGWILSAFVNQSQGPLLVITRDMLTAVRLHTEINFFLGHTVPVTLFPDWEILAYDQFSPHHDIISERLKTLSTLPYQSRGILLTPISTVMQRLSPREFLDRHVFLLNVNDTLDLEILRNRLTQAGYRAREQVREHGEFAMRGAIIDLYPMGSALPYRIDLLDNVIDSIRTFSPDTQRSLETIQSIQLLPAKEFPLDRESIELFRTQWRETFSGNPLHCPVYLDITENICSPGIEYYLPLFFKETATFFDYLPKETQIIRIDNLHDIADTYWKEINTRYEQRAHDKERPILPPQTLYLPIPDLFHHLKSYGNITLQASPITDDTPTLHFPIQPVPHYPLTASQTITDKIDSILKNTPGRLLFCADSTGRREVLLQLLNTMSLHPVIYATWHDFIDDSAPFGLCVAALDEGFSLNDPAITLITESQLFGKRIAQTRRRQESSRDTVQWIQNLEELNIGDPVIHIDHGVGRYLGLKTLAVNDTITEFVSLEYANQDKLYVPVTSLHCISRYSGTDADSAPLHKLGTEQWQRAKRKAAEEIRDIAAELLETQAKRAAEVGFAFSIPELDYAQFANAFPFEETHDQQRAIDQILEDMVKNKPMDRVICGDVGFGKTEVAMRAAFIAVQNHKQVAVLVPTTLLAEQHGKTFQDRFADWPVVIEVISRFKSPKEQRLLIERLKEGKIDIIIGTHKLLQKDIFFQALGLIIVDEEHRFGVKQKDRLQAIRHNVDLLTLTATPIPRTLNMALSGIRDLSIIATPPSRRLSVKTFVYEYRSAIIQEALHRELLRGGQVYFLHNDIATIQKTARELSALSQEARITIAHGQMPESELEQIMSDFYHRRFNVLVCTTIIESGIDIPSANTILINRADKFGLAQLHQLRGRVGRSHHQAYAYLLIPSRQSLTPDAEKRLDAIASLEELGMGFTLATHDLEIRGAGELLGENQSGHMHAIGFTLYMDLLTRTVDALKAGHTLDIASENPVVTEINCQVPAFIPEDYLPDIPLRLQLYKRIANAKTSQALDDIQIEMIDRFGLLPDKVKTLFAVHALRLKMEAVGILRVDANDKGGILEFTAHPAIPPDHIIHLLQTQPKRLRFDGPTRLRFAWEAHARTDRLLQLASLFNLLTDF